MKAINDSELMILKDKINSIREIADKWSDSEQLLVRIIMSSIREVLDE